MGKIIIVTGHLAALKTTIAQRLGHDLSLLCLNKDSIKEILGESIGFNNREENLKLSKATFYLMKSMAEKMLEIDQSLILESNFKDFELHALRTTLDNSKHQCLTLYLSGDDQTLYERYVMRQANRHPVHTSTGLMTLEEFKELMQAKGVGSCFGEIIEIDTTPFCEDDYQDLLEKVKRFICRML